MLKSIIKTKKQKTDRENPRTNDKIKAIQTKSHKETNTYTFINREKVKKYIYIYLYIFKKKEEESNQINNQIYQ